MFLVLCVLFFIKHYLADWQFQTLWMVQGKRRDGWSFVWPLAAHAGLHGALTFLLVLGLLSWFDKPYFLVAGYVGFADFGMHFAIDRCKALLERFSRDKRWLLFLLALDQLSHLVVTLIIIDFLRKFLLA